MRTRLIGGLSLICLIVTIFWLVFLIADLAAAGRMGTFDQALSHVAN